MLVERVGKPDRALSQESARNDLASAAAALVVDAAMKKLKACTRLAAAPDAGAAKGSAMKVKKAAAFVKGAATKGTATHLAAALVAGPATKAMIAFAKDLFSGLSEAAEGGGGGGEACGFSRDDINKAQNPGPLWERVHDGHDDEERRGIFKRQRPKPLF